MSTDRIIVMGASAGGVHALEQVVAGLPAGLAAAVMVVLHLSAKHKSLLPQILAAAGPLPAAAAQDGETLSAGRIYVASPDCHLIVDAARVKVTKGPKENHFRPSIDVLFRSAAYHFGARAVGVVLSGSLSDGASGLFAIRRLGGMAVIQDPAEALYSSMPLSALARVDVDYTLPVAQIGPLLADLVKQPPRAEPSDAEQYRRSLKFEIDVSAAESDHERGIMEIADASPYTCPECHGVLFRIKEGNVDRFRCHTGHGFSSQALLEELVDTVEDSLWGAVRTLQETMTLLSESADRLGTGGDDAVASELKAKISEIEQRLNALRSITLDEAGLRTSGKEAAG